MARVKISDTNLRHCRCPQCPVQAQSDCSKRILEEEKVGAEAGNMGKLYCAGGKSSCVDLNKNETCICSSCLVWDENDLGSMYYCLRGRAEDKG
jgi:hypothetical protein